MNIKEIKRRKDALEKEFRERLEHFSRETAMHVTHVDVLTRRWIPTGEVCEYHVQIAVVL